MSYALRGALVVDGSGSAARRADVVIEGGRIASVGESPGVRSGVEEVDLSGLVLAPGFIDIHTHYDAQVLWDPELTPSCWHGVTTVAMGNCGFGIAPTRPEHRSTIARTLENVEGMSAEALEAGIPWGFETFPEYLDTLDGIPKRINVGAFIGHTPLRLYVMGDDAIERAATDDEVDDMRRAVLEAMAAGALGFATSRSPTHAGAGGRPVPSRLAEVEEVFRIADALRQAGKGVVQVTPGPGLFLDEFASLSTELGLPVTWTALLTGFGARGTATALAERTAALGGEVWPQIACRPLVMQVALEDPFPIAMLPSMKEVLAVPRGERAGVYADQAWRERARPEVSKAWATRWSKMSIEETGRHHALRGRTVAELADERGVEPFDVLVDLSLDKRTVLGLSDAGAHASQLCDACFSTHLLGYWSRERGTLPLEEAVWRLTGHPAQVFRLEGRGLVREGYAADLVAFDAEKVGTTEARRTWDLPAGADRLVVDSLGIEHVWVGGVATRADGMDVEDARPGRLLRR